jgi:hypothetical protein
MSAYVFQFIGTGLLATFNSLTPAWQHFTFVVPAGLGFGGTITILLIALISSVDVKGFLGWNGVDGRSSYGYGDELFVSQHGFCCWYNDISVRSPESFENMVDEIYPWT